MYTLCNESFITLFFKISSSVEHHSRNHIRVDPNCTETAAEKRIHLVDKKLKKEGKALTMGVEPIIF